MTFKKDVTMKRLVNMFGRDGITMVRRSAELRKLSDYVYCMVRKHKGGDRHFLVIENDGEYYAVMQVSPEDISEEMTLDWFIHLMVSWTVEQRYFDRIQLRLLKGFGSVLYNAALKSNRAYEEKLTEKYLKEDGKEKDNEGNV